MLPLCGQKVGAILSGLVTIVESFVSIHLKANAASFKIDCFFQSVKARNAALFYVKSNNAKFCG